MLIDLTLERIIVSFENLAVLGDFLNSQLGQSLHNSPTLTFLSNLARANPAYILSNHITLVRQRSLFAVSGT
jgi:hypothetical protein